MRIVLASDHAGFALKGVLVQYLKEEGHAVEDLGPHRLNPEDDYPDYCIPAAQKVASDPELLGIVIGFSGQGEAMAGGHREWFSTSFHRTNGCRHRALVRPGRVARPGAFTGTP